VQSAGTARARPSGRAQAADGRYYLDVYWSQRRLVVEIDGIQHSWAGQQVDDALRQNRVTLENETVLRPVLGLRVAPDEFFEQIEEGLRSGATFAPVVPPDPRCVIRTSRNRCGS